MARVWAGPFRDARIILEQGGQLRYFQVHSRLQRLIVRTGLLAAAGGLLLLGLLGASSLWLAMKKSRLERAHRAIYAALIASSGDAKAGTPDDMMALVRAIQDRQIAMRQYLGFSAEVYKGENAGLMGHLEASGLTEVAILAIERASAYGGLKTDDAGPTAPQKMLPDELISDIVRNRALLETLRALPQRMPLAAGELTSDFGIRKHPITEQIHFHTGVDFVLSGPDETVRAVKGGKVLAAYVHPNLGNTVVLQHSHGVETLYGHLDSIAVQAGQMVQANDVLGIVGNTGQSTGRHLHFEILVNGYPTHPLKVIKAARNVQQI